jgi:hypothetical protein
MTRLARWTSAALMALVGLGGEDHARPGATGVRQRP